MSTFRTRRLVQAHSQFRDATEGVVIEPATVASLAPVQVTWRGATVAVQYPAGAVLTVGQTVQLVKPPNGNPFVLVLTGP